MVLALLLAVGVPVALVRIRPKRLAMQVTAGVLALPLLYWLVLRPSNDRDWQPDVAVLPYAVLDGEQVTIHSIRNCDYRAADDFDVRYYDRTFALGDLESIDMFLVDWGLRKVAHTMLSFGFGDGQFVCISIETRKEKGEAYSATKGLFRNYELIYVVGDERDLVRLRTNYREAEDVRMYRLKPASDQVTRDVFLDFMARISSLREHPQWYNALTSNCMTSAFCHFRRHAPKARFHWKLILNGYADELLYRDGGVDTSLPFDELRERSLINDQARAAGASPDFSRLIRVGLPGVEEPANRAAPAPKGTQ